MSLLILLLKSIFTFFATEIDDFLVFVMLFNKNQGKKQHFVIIFAQILILLLVTVLCGFVAVFISKIPESLIKYFGLIPFVIGIISIFKKDDDDDGEKEVASGKLIGLFFTTALLVIASSGDNLGIYIPFFIDMSVFEKVIVLAVFLVLQICWSLLQIKAAQLNAVQKVITKAGRFFEPIVFIGLGVLIFVEHI